MFNLNVLSVDAFSKIGRLKSRVITKTDYNKRHPTKDIFFDI